MGYTRFLLLKMRESLVGFVVKVGFYKERDYVINVSLVLEGFRFVVY